MAQALTYCHRVPNDCFVVGGDIGSDKDKRNRSTDLFLLHGLLGATLSVVSSS